MQIVYNAGRTDLPIYKPKFSWKNAANKYINYLSLSIIIFNNLSGKCIFIDLILYTFLTWRVFFVLLGIWSLESISNFIK